MEPKKEEVNNTTVLFDEKLGERTVIAEEIEKYYSEHPEKRKPGDPSLQLKTDKKAGELYRITKQINEYNSLKKQNASKKTRKGSLLDAKKLAVIGVAGVTIGITACLGIEVGKKIGERNAREEAYQEAIEYMSENVMPEVLEEAGYTIQSIDENNKFVYNYDASNIRKAEDILVTKYGFTYDTAELLYAEYSNFDDTIYVLRGKDNAYEYYQSLGYKNKDSWDDIAIFNTPTDIFINMNQNQLTSQVENIRNNQNLEGDISARS